MSITPKNLIRHELIGLLAEVVKSTHPNYIGIKGKVIDETKNTLIIDQNGKEKTIPKAEVTLHFTLPEDTIVEVYGKLLVGRPEDRIKKRIEVK
ncbi:MAG: ribonuclease P protein component 1 [Euryarchaeota archaeon]|nr:ribonuclease P protein component 1 [Euryarchaeota archaeon]